MGILVFIVFYFMDSTVWFVVISCAIWSTDQKVVLNLSWVELSLVDVFTKHRPHANSRNYPHRGNDGMVPSAAEWRHLQRARSIPSLPGVIGVHSAVLSLITLTFDLWRWPSNSNEQGTKHVFPVNLAQIRSAVPEICEWQANKKQTELECGLMPNVMAALPNIGGALCSTPQSLADAHY